MFSSESLTVNGGVKKLKCVEKSMTRRMCNATVKDVPVSEELMRRSEPENSSKVTRKQRV